MSGYDDTAIGSFDFHHSMLADSVRTESFFRAILAGVRPGDVVVDIGCGTGVLSMFAVMAGARRVHAIEQEPIIDIARQVAVANGLADRIDFIAAPSTEVELTEPADVIVSETIGNIGFDEGWLAWMNDAAARFARPDARFIPSRIDVVGAPVRLPRDRDAVQRWSEPLLGLDFSPLRRLAANNVMWIDVNPVALVDEPRTLLTAGVGHDAVESLSATFSARHAGTVDGIAAWFRSDLGHGVTITNAPPNAVPSWEQGLFPVMRTIDVSTGDRISVQLETTTDGSEWAWEVDGQRMTTASGRLVTTTD